MFKKRERNINDRKFKEDLVAEVLFDYQKRREERRAFEAQWQLNSNFLAGNQYCLIGLSGEIEGGERDYFWQEREVFNHIAPIIETRLAKLSKVKPKMSVRPFGGDDIADAEAATKILNSALSKLNLDGVLENGTRWAELTGSVFYKLSWDKNAGRAVGQRDGEPIFEGDVRIDVCPPYEIFPPSLSCHDIEDCHSIIHAKALPIEDIEELWGVTVEGGEVDTVAMDGISVVGGLGLSSAIPKYNRSGKKDHAIVVERYTRPSADCPEGELTIIAGKTLLHHGAIPFKCGADGGFGLPFIKQDALSRAGCFFGTSVIERLIPVQRAYNAVKNRKHEFMNRIAMGVLAVEDGSVDTDNLETEGLSPGKILVYRQGAPMPAFLDAGTIPSDFGNEEDRLIGEFIMISGVSEIMRSSSTPSSVSSGAALKLLLDQDDTRILATAQQIRRAAKNAGQLILRFYKQFARQPRLSRFAGKGGKIELIGWKNSHIISDDVVFDNDNELSDTLASRRAAAAELLNMGLLTDNSGKIPQRTHLKLLDMLGCGGWVREEDFIKEDGDERTDAQDRQV